MATRTTFDDLGIEDTPPKSMPRRTNPTTAKTTGNVPWAEIEASLTSSYMMAGGAIALTPKVPDRMRPIGQALMMNAEQCTAAWIEAAKKNPKLAKALTRFVSGGAYAGVVAAHMPILFAAVAAANPRMMAVQEQGDKDESSTQGYTDMTVNTDMPLFGVA